MDELIKENEFLREKIKLLFINKFLFILFTSFYI